MKVAISIPDEIFLEAESLAKRLNTSRSEMYSRALSEFLGHHSPDRLTEAMNAAVDSFDAASADEDRAFVAEAARQRLKAIEW